MSPRKANETAQDKECLAINRSIGRQISAARGERPVKAMARKTSLSATALFNAETGIPELRVRTLVQMSRAVGLNPVDVFWQAIEDAEAEAAPRPMKREEAAVLLKSAIARIDEVPLLYVGSALNGPLKRLFEEALAQVNASDTKGTELDCLLEEAVSLARTALLVKEGS